MAKVLDFKARGRRNAELWIWACRRDPSAAKTLVVEAAQCGFLDAHEAEEWICFNGWEAS